MVKKDDYLSKIDKIPTVSFNKEQKIIAKKILEKTDEKDLDAVYGLITQRVKTGFVFDKAPEVNHNAVAIVKENKELRIDGDSLDCIEHKLIIGENYDALKNLCATYIDKNGKGLIDVIYIDPPYNTEATKQEGNDYKEDIEATKFIYRDKFTRDGWLNMMNERLKLAKQLLSDSGVIFISIDDNEQAYLKVLCDEIFGEDNFVACCSRKTKSFDRDKSNKKLQKLFDYLLIYSKNNNYFSIEQDIVGQKIYSQKDEIGSYKLNPLQNTGPDGYKDLRPNTYYPIFLLLDGNLTPEKPNDEKNIKKVFLPQKIGNRDGRWSWQKSKILTDNFRLVIKNESLYIKIYKSDDEDMNRYKSKINLLDFSNASGTSILTKLNLQDIFNNPKPVDLIKWCLKAQINKNTTVLDFFAGSGTTGQAVMELNAEDGGKRQFILVTNNENNIGEKITRERLYRVIKGKGSNCETFDWTYKKDTPYLNKNSVRVFNIETHELTLNDLDKAEDLKEKAKLEFKKLNQNYSINNDFDIYNELSALNPQKLDKDCK